MESIKIKLLPPTASTNLADIERITNIVNRVYAASEGDLWESGSVRTSVEEIADFIKDGEIAVAQLKGQIVGSVRVRQVNQETGEFGMLAVDDKYQGSGVGRSLIQFAEQQCEKENLCKMQLELLVPVKGTHPTKVMLKKWYTGLGYRQVCKETVEVSLPKVAHLLTTPCNIIIFQKELG